MYNFFCVAMFTTSFFSCNNLKQEKVNENIIIGKWRITEINTKGNSEKAPGLTVFNFMPDSSYSLNMFKNDSLLAEYKGRYAAISCGNNQLLITAYKFQNKLYTDTSTILLLDKTNMNIYSKADNDTIYFERIENDK